MQRFGVLGAVLLTGLLARADTAAVLPFVSAPSSGVSQTSLDWVGESIAETVRDALASRGIMTLDRDDILEAYNRLDLREHALLTRASVMKVGETL